MNKTKKGIIAFLLAAALLVSMVGMASAGETYWFLKDYNPSVNGADYEMEKNNGHGTSPAYINNGASKIWVANASTPEAATFAALATWTVHLDYADCTGSRYLENGETITAEIGYLNSTTGTFTGVFTLTDSGSGIGCPSGKSSSHNSTTPGSWTVPKGNYLALNLSMSGGNVAVETTGAVNSSSWIRCEATDDCTYPVPELPTIILTSAGLLALFGYVVYRRRNGKSQ